jgi:hypothetical protein
MTTETPWTVAFATGGRTFASRLRRSGLNDKLCKAALHQCENEGGSPAAFCGRRDILAMAYA